MVDDDARDLVTGAVTGELDYDDFVDGRILDPLTVVDAIDALTRTGNARDTPLSGRRERAVWAVGQGSRG
jgi:hypothetical protein